MKLRTVAPAATVALAALALLAGCKKGDSNANSTNTKNTTAISNTATNTTATPAPLGSPTTTASAASSPTEAFRLYYEAVKRKDGPAVKGLLSRSTTNMMEQSAKSSNMSFDAYFDQMFKAVGSDVPPTLPESRNEKINGDRATLEINDVKKGKWETLNFVNEGGWKISFEDADRGPNTGGEGDNDKGDQGGGDDDHGGH
jgi:hypothetical protein